MNFKNAFKDLSKFELALWLSSVLVVSGSSFHFKYFGEMITYLCMTAPIQAKPNPTAV